MSELLALREVKFEMCQTQKFYNGTLVHKMRNNREEVCGTRRYGCSKYYTSERILILNKLFISV